MSKFQKILDSFKIRETLNPKVWDDYEDVEMATLKPDIRKKLLQISEEFSDNLGEELFLEDIVLMGSLVNYNWSEFSDFDLHLLIDFQQYEDEADLYREIFELKKKVFNEKHDIKIHGYDVEVYAQGAEDEHSSSGVYSIMNNEWVQTPTKEGAEIDFDFLKKKVKSWIAKIEDAIKSDDVEKMKSLREKIKEYRKCGLEERGEFSYENLVFKFLRRSEMIGKLFDAITKTKDKELSLESVKNIKEEISEKDEIYNTLSNSSFLKKMMSLVDNSLYFEYTPGQKIPYEPPVEAIQSGLQYLGFSLPKWGVDGKFGPETTQATMDFQESVGIPPTGIFGIKELKYMIALLIQKGFSDNDLGGIQHEREYNLDNSSDIEFYKTLLNKLGAPITNENLKFLLAWRQAEGKSGLYNPFNTTHRLQDSTDFNSVGVQNYKNLDDGLYATLKTLTNGRYNCIVNGLINDIGASEIAKCQSLHTWGTGTLVSKVLSGYESGAEIKSPSLR